MRSLTVSEIAGLCAGAAEGDLLLEVSSVNAIEEAEGHQVSFVGNRKSAALAQNSNAGCLLVPLDFENFSRRTVVRVPSPRAAFARVVAVLHPPASATPLFHPSAAIALTATVPAGCHIGPHVTIGEHAVLGNGCVIQAGSVVGDFAVLGDSCLVYPNVTIYTGVRIGSRAILHSGCVIGADGFGFAFSSGAYEKFPQIGIVEIGNDVELGANTCVDRAALGATRVGDGTKIDNMVHIGHNCRIGRHVVIAAQTGLSGGVVVEDYAVVGGQVGVGDKATIKAKAIVGSGAGILTSKIVHAGEPVWGTPARPLRQYLRQLASLTKLPDALEQLRAIQKRLDSLEGG